jgi:hypothetical protein
MRVPLRRSLLASVFPDPIVCRYFCRLTRASAPLGGDEGRPGADQAVTTPATRRWIHPQSDRRPSLFAGDIAPLESALG